ncbi:MAG: hypothetical protein IKL55_05675 [Clostridia bacterium]|nr:hypothetical protein [Clostridia bacterium]
MAKQRINNSIEDSKSKKKIVKFLKIILIIVFFIFANLYIVLQFMNKGKNFTIYLENGDPQKYNLTLYENKETKRKEKIIKVETPENFSDMSIDWLPENLNEETDGSHNGNNYIAYTFYVENQGQESVNYTTEIKITDVVREIDEALRVIVYRNGQKTVYAKTSKETGLEEPETKAFVDESTIMQTKTTGFGVGSIDKYTIVIFIEGNDPECTDRLIGGEIGIDMYIREELLPEPEEWPEGWNEFLREKAEKEKRRQEEKNRKEGQETSEN